MSAVRIYLSLTILLTVSSCFCANILAIVPTPSYSHQIPYAPLWKELSLRGHKVTVITTDPQKDPKLTNLTEIDTKFTYKFMGGFSGKIETEVNMWTNFGYFIDIMVDVTEAQMSLDSVKSLMEPKEKFDVVLVEIFFPEFLAFAELHNCPKIIISTLDANSFIHRLIGNPTHPVLMPDFFTALHENLSFKERVISTIFDLYMELYMGRRMFRTKQNILDKYFNTTSTIQELISSTDMMFLNTNPVWLGVRALGPSTITVGGYKRVTSMNPLPKDVKDFLDNANEGFIYFSFGNIVKSKDLRNETLTAIIEALRQLPYRVLWKFEADELPGKPNNVKLVKWAPQQSVLAHPNIKLFVSHGGLQSMEESIYSEVPLVVVPFFGDQEQNAKRMQSKGIAVTVNVRPYLDKDKLKSAILEVINNPRYRNAVIRLKQLVLDNSMNGLEKAVWWTEYVIRNKGAKHLRNPAADLPFYQYYLLDVLSFLISVAVLVISVTVWILKVLVRFISSKINVQKVTTGKKIN